MAVLKFVKDLSPTGQADGFRADPATATAITSVVMPRDRAAVASLAEEAREGTVSFSSRGLVAELESREGRRIAAWLAWQPATLGPRPVGVVMLAETEHGVSIPWLLVDPDVRRQGVARALVGVAVAHARSLRASSITAESLASWPEACAFWPAVGFALAQPAMDID